MLLGNRLQEYLPNASLAKVGGPMVWLYHQSMKLGRKNRSWTVPFHNSTSVMSI